MRNLHLEAAIWYFFTSPEFFEMAAKECEDTMEWFGKLAISRGTVNLGRNNQVYDAFKKAARNFRRGAEFARLGDFKVAYDAASSISSDIRGMMEQPFHSWMTATEYTEFESTRISNILAYESMIQHSLNNALTGAEIFFDADPEYPDMKNWDYGFPDDEIVRWFNNYADREYYDLTWSLPAPLPQYEIDTSRSCQTGEEVPWTGVWYPETGLERHSLTFAIKGLRMQPVFFTVKNNAELEAEGEEFPRPETKAVATTWRPVIPTARPAPTNDGELRAKAGEPCPQTGLWQSLDSEAALRAYKEGEIMTNLNSAYGLTIWRWTAHSRSS